MTLELLSTGLIPTARHAGRIELDKAIAEHDDLPQNPELQSHEVRTRAAATQPWDTLFLVEPHPCVGDPASWCHDELARASDHDGHHAPYTMG